MNYFHPFIYYQYHIDNSLYSSFWGKELVHLLDHDVVTHIYGGVVNRVGSLGIVCLCKGYLPVMVGCLMGKLFKYFHVRRGPFLRAGYIRYSPTSVSDVPSSKFIFG